MRYSRQCAGEGSPTSMQILHTRCPRALAVAFAIAAATLLLGDDASFITGQTLIADGGQIACQDNGRMIPAAESD